MEFTSRVLYGKELSYYNVLKLDEEKFKARLLENFGPEELPKVIVLEKKDNRWVGDADECILHYLNFDIRKRLEPSDEF